MVEGLQPDPDLGFVTYEISETGTLVYRAGGRVSGQGLVWVDREGREESLGLEPGVYRDAVVSPDGTRVAMVVDAGGLEGDICVWSLRSHTLSRLTFDPGLELAPLWTKDGKRIIYSRFGHGLFWRPADGTGSAETVLDYPGYAGAGGWSADGGLVVGLSGSGGSIELVSVNGAGARTPLLDGARHPDPSPDGHWLAYQSNVAGTDEVFVRPFPDVDAGKWQVSSGGGEEPLWSRDGRSLYYSSPSSLMTTPVTTTPTFASGTPRPVLDRSAYFLPNTARNYDVAPDGRLLVLKEAPAADGPPQEPRVTVVFNWFEELKRRVPTR